MDCVDMMIGKIYNIKSRLNNKLKYNYPTNFHT